MNAPITEFVQIAEQGQKIAGQAVRTWTETVRSYADSISQGRPALPELSAAVDAYFDRAAELLATQRETAATVVAAGTEVVEGAVERARTLAASFVPAAAKN